MIKVFHGSDHIIKIPRYMGGKTDNDYGNGFYTTEYEERARSWATLNGNPQKSIVNMYQLDLDGLNILDLNERGVLAWIAEVVSKLQVLLEKGLLNYTHRITMGTIL